MPFLFTHSFILQKGEASTSKSFALESSQLRATRHYVGYYSRYGVMHIVYPNGNSDVTVPSSFSLSLSVSVKLITNGKETRRYEFLSAG